MGFSKLSSINKINKRGSSTTNNTQSFTSLLASKVPWAKYKGSSYANGILLDEINGRNAICTDCVLSTTTGNGGGTVPISVCRGYARTIVSTIIFPVGSIPANYTIAFITRYAGSATNRILTGHQAQNFILGHHASKMGMFYDGTQWITPTTTNATGALGNWVNMCVVSGGTAIPNNVQVNGIGKGVNVVTSNSGINQLAINTSSYNEKSTFELAHVIIWDSVLSLNEMKTVTDAFGNYLITGILQ